MASPADGTALDARSLTLPDWRAALKRRLRRPRRPDPLRRMQLFFALWTGLVAALNFVVGDLPNAATNLILCALWWAVAHLPRSDRTRLLIYSLALLVMMLVNGLVFVARITTA